MCKICIVQILAAISVALALLHIVAQSLHSMLIAADQPYKLLISSILKTHYNPVCVYAVFVPVPDRLHRFKVASICVVYFFFTLVCWCLFGDALKSIGRLYHFLNIFLPKKRNISKLPILLPIVCVIFVLPILFRAYCPIFARARNLGAHF